MSSFTEILPAVSDDAMTVMCLCAEWCGTCREYRPVFMALEHEFPAARFLWFDIEDDANELGDLDVENFPTLLIRRAGWVLFFGTLLPQIGHLRRLLEAFGEQTPEQCRALAVASEESRGWQQNTTLVSVGVD